MTDDDRREIADGWQATLRYRVATHALIVSGDRMLGRVSPAAEQARVDIVAALDAAVDAGASEKEIDAVLANEGL